MRLTRRGLGALLLAGLAVVMAAWFGPRSLNGVAAPLAGGVFVGALLLWRAEPPSVTASPVGAGHPGETRTVQFDVDGGGTCRVTHEWPAGLRGDSIDAVLVPPATLSADVEYAERGIHEVSLAEIRQRDPLGLVERVVEPGAASEAVVYPQVYDLSDRSVLGALFADDAAVERQEFDRLREYAPGDPLRHVHWKSSAKHDEFLVTEFSPGRQTDTLIVAGEATPGCDDAMAEAVGTIATAASRAGLAVGVELPDGTLAPATGEVHVSNLLRLLARTSAGELPERRVADADVAISALPRETLVRIGDRTRPFGHLLTDDPEAVIEA